MMRDRSIGAVAVVVVGLAPVLFGGPVLPVAMTAIGLVALGELITIVARIGLRPIPTAYLVIPVFALAGLQRNPFVILAIVVVALFVPLAVVVWRAEREDVLSGSPAERLDAGFTQWAATGAISLYLGLPVAAAVALRQTEGEISAVWLRNIAETLSITWEPYPRGLAWLLTWILVTWIGDTTAYLVGRSFGRRRIAPRVSPNKTVEGSIGGLIGSAVVAVVATSLFGLEVNGLWAALAGAMIGAFGQIGDLGESLFKRQARVKDSGNLIRGHGGMLDRIDALLVVLTVGWFATLLLDRFAR